MQKHEIKAASPRKYKRQVGRGGKRGKTSGRGTKGQNARAGRKFRPVMRDTIKKLPKLRGYAFNSPNIKPVAINLKDIEQYVQNGDIVNPNMLVERGILEKVLGKTPRTKILGKEFSKKVTFEGLLVSKSSKEAIEKAGGSVK
jgi:large subunit ribosomal protein L15